MKILFLSGYSDPRGLGGIETFGRNLGKIFYDIKYLVFKNKLKKYFNLDNIIEIDNINFFWKILSRIAKNKKLREKIKKRGKINFLRNKIKEIRPDICIINYPEELYSIKNMKNIKKILIQHREYNSYVSVYCRGKQEIIDLIKSEVDFFIFLSPYDREKFIKELGISQGKSRVIRHTSEIELLKTKKVRDKNLLIISRLDNNHKRIDLAIRAMKKLPDFILNIYGEGKDREKLEKLILEENIKNVFLKGATTKVQEILDKNSIFIMTSDYEGYGITNIEAMRRGLPLILRNTFEAAPDIIVNNSNGILLSKEWKENEFVEAVKEIYDNYEKYSENSVILGKRYNLDIIKKQWDNLITEI